MKRVKILLYKVFAVMTALTLLPGYAFFAPSPAYAAVSKVTIVSTNPDDDEEDVSVDEIIKFRFSGDMDPDTIDEDSVYIEDEDGDRIDADVSYNERTRYVTVTPEDDLEYDTEYTVFVTDDVEDEDGRDFDGYRWSFTTEAGEIKITVSPKPGATSVSVRTRIEIEFDEEMDENTIDEDSIYIKDKNGDVVDADVTYDEDDYVVKIYPDDNLNYDTRYTVYITDDVEDADGNEIEEYKWSFTTEATDSNVKEMYPKAGSKDVPEYITVRLRFKSAMKGSSIDEDTVYIKDEDGDVVDADVSYNHEDYLIKIRPKDKLDYDTVYTVYVTDDVEDSKGKDIDEITWSFTTRKKEDSGEEKANSGEAAKRTPAPDETGVITNIVVSYVFDSPVDQTTVNGNNIYLQNAATAAPVPVRIAYSSDARKVIMMPVNSLDVNTRYTVTISNRVKFSDGVSVPAESWSFTTDAVPTNTGGDTPPAAPAGPFTRTGSPGNPLVMLNNQYLVFTDAAPYIKNDRTMIPVKALCDALGAQTAWDGAVQKVTIQLNDNTFVLHINSRVAFRNNSLIMLDVPAEISNDRTMVPLSMVSQGLGVNVQWDAETYTVVMTM